MSALAAWYYDGETSRRAAVTLHFYREGSLEIQREGEEPRRYPLGQIEVASRLGNTPRALRLPDGGKCEVADNDALDAILDQHRPGHQSSFLHALESRARYIVLILLVGTVATLGFFQYGIPLLAERIAYNLPTQVDAYLGQDSLAVLDDWLLEESELSAETQQKWRERFADMVEQHPSGHEFRLEFRGGGILGANALALPSGIVVVTDEFMELAEHDHEITAVLAHEVGHVLHRHGLRTVLQHSAVFVIITTLTGDINSLTALSATLPSILLEAKYSRDFEREADDFAIRYLQAHDISPRYLAEMLHRLTEDQDTDEKFQYLSSHPATAERIATIRAAEVARQPQ